MGFFSRKKDKTPAEGPRSTAPASLLVDESLVAPRARRVAPQQSSNPRTEVLGFLHEASKSCGLREFIRTYLFHFLNDVNFVVTVEMKVEALRADPEALLARWQLLQLGVMRYAQGKGIPLVGVYWSLPLDKARPLPVLETQARLGKSILPGVPDRPEEDAGQHTIRAMSASRFMPMELDRGMGAAEIEVNESPDSDLGREFFGSDFNKDKS